MTEKIIIIGAGAAGLMAASDLAKSGKQVVILEAKDRVGGRIWALPESEFGYAAEAGAEFVHGGAPITKTIIKQAGLTLLDMDGEVWTIEEGKAVKANADPASQSDFQVYRNEVEEKLKQLEGDLPVADFLEKYFSAPKYEGLRDWILKMVQGYDAADPKRISVKTVGEEWLGGGEWQQGRIKEGYGAVLEFLQTECRKNGAEILLNHQVEAIEFKGDGVTVKCKSGQTFLGDKCIVTLSLGALPSVKFNPALPDKLAAAEKIGFGQVVKFLLKFKTRWWENAFGQDLSKMMFMVRDAQVRVWWTQYPLQRPVLTGWITGPAAEDLKSATDETILEISLDSLADTFQIGQDFIKKELLGSKVINWPADPFSRGAYSYTTVETKMAYQELAKPVQGKIFFAGEAPYKGKDTATVEGALASGKDVAEKILALD